MRKVAFFLCSDTIGGHEFQSIELILTAMSYCEPTLFLNIPQHKDLIKHCNIKHIECNEPFFKRGNFISQLLYAIKNGSKIRRLASGFDQIVICAGTVEAGICCGYALRKKLIYQYVPTFVDRKQLWGRIGTIYNLLLNIFIYPYNGIITINRIQGRYFSRFKQIFVMPNKIEEKDIYKQKYKNDDDDNKLYFVGRLEKEKRIIELINWLDHPDNRFTKFVIVGDGSQRDEIISKIKTTKHITIVLKNWLNREDQENEFSCNDVFVINSRYEGEPLVIREANNRGSVVLARNIPGIRSCTHSSNRFNTSSELIHLIELAHAGKLRICNNPTKEQIQRTRDHVAKQIFI